MVRRIQLEATTVAAEVRVNSDAETALQEGREPLTLVLSPLCPLRESPPRQGLPGSESATPGALCRRPVSPPLQLWAAGQDDTQPHCPCLSLLF